MFEGNPNTTNLLLGILVAASVLQTLVLIGACVVAIRFYLRTRQTIRDIEQRLIAPLGRQITALLAKVDGILGDVKDVTGRVTRQAERVDVAIDHTMHRVDETTGQVCDSVASRINQIVGLVHGVTYAVQGLFRGRRSGETPTT